MLHWLFAVIGTVITALTYVLTPALSPWWIVPIWAAACLAALIVYLLLLVIVSFCLPHRDPPPYFPLCRHIVVVTLSWAMDMLRVRTHLTGTEKLPTDRPFLLVCNHRSNIDPLITLTALHKWKLVFVSKPENFRIPVVGPFMHSASFLAIDRENPRNAVKTIHQAADFIRERQLCIGIYPEGTRNRNSEELLPFHNGSFKIAKMAGCPVAVMTLRYGKRRWFFGEKPVHMDIVSVMDEEFVAQNNTATLSQQARTAMEQHGV